MHPLKAGLFLLFFVSALLSCVTPASQRTVGSPAIQQAIQAIEVEGNVDQGISELLRFLNKHETVYRQNGFLVTLCRAYSWLAKAYVQKRDFGKAFEFAQKGSELIDEIDRVGIQNVDDNGSGQRIVRGTPSAYDPADMRAMHFYGSQFQVHDALRLYYQAAGDDTRAEEMTEKSKAAYQAMKPYIRKMTRTAQRIRASQEPAKPGQQASSPSKEKDPLKYHQDMLSSAFLHAKILQKHHTDETEGLEALIDKWVQEMIAHDRFMEFKRVNIQNHKNAGQLKAAADFKRIYDYYENHLLKSWSEVLKAFVLLEIERPREAERHLRKGCALFTNAERPVIRTNTVRAWLRLAHVPVTGEIPLPWKTLEAEILTELGSDRALQLWEEVRHDLSKPHENAFTAVQFKFFRDHYNEKVDLILSDIYHEKGRYPKALALIDKVLEKRESARSTFSREAHKIGYLAANRRLYDRFLALSEHDPDINLVAMERAKSRSMVDLMVQNMGDMREPLLADFAEQRQVALKALENGPGKEGQRAISVNWKDVEKELRSLKEKKPQLYSLVSVEAPSLDEVKSLLPADAAVLSYYVTDDGIYVNVLSQAGHYLTKVDVSRMALFEGVYRFRSRMGKGEVTNERPHHAGIALSWKMERGAETVRIKNHLPFPLEIYSMTRLEQGFFPHIAFPFLPVPVENQIGITPVTRIVDAMEEVVIHQRERSAEYTGGQVEELFLDTNIGRLHAEAIMLKPEDMPASLTVIEKPAIAWEPLERSLYEVLIAPVENHLRAKHLIVVPHGMLHFLPFDALKDKNDVYLLEKFAVSYAPSLNVLKYCRANNRGSKEYLVAYGDSLGDLTGARSEIRQIRSLFPRSDVFVGREVTQENISRSMKQADIVHFACHGVFNPLDPLHSGLVMASGDATGRATSFHSIRKDELVLLTVTDIMGMDCSPYLVMLSACDTGLSRISGGDELIGLQRGFFTAGAPSLITTLWPIADEPTARLVARFYTNMLKKGMDKAAALQDAKLHLIESGYPDPYYWSPFILQGDWM